MVDNRGTGISEFDAFFKDLDSNDQSEISAQLFLEYCIFQDQRENRRRLAPLVNTVAEALVGNAEQADSLKIGIKTVQMYLRLPPVEYFGETLEKLKYLDRQNIDEMLEIQPKGKMIGTFLMEQGLITQEQRDIAVIVQKRLFTIREVHTRILNSDSVENDVDIVESLKGVFQHFLMSTAELEADIKDTDSENIHNSLHRLENVITETENNTHKVLEIVDRFFDLEDEIKDHLNEIKKNIKPDNKGALTHIEKIIKRLDFFNALNLELNSSQQIQDRIGQQLLKIMPVIQAFHEQILKIAKKLKLDWGKIHSDESGSMRAGYEGNGLEERIGQDQVDEMLLSLGL